MSALPSKADIPQHCLDVRFGPIGDIQGIRPRRDLVKRTRVELRPSLSPYRGQRQRRLLSRLLGIGKTGITSTDSPEKINR
jgi:hypothetical protein